MQQEEEQLRKRLLELSEKSYHNSQYLFTDFLNESELAVAMEVSHGSSSYGEGFLSTYGGYEGAGRQMVRFGSMEAFGYEEPFPIACIKCEPFIRKFADELSHRDFLGALMNLGIERKVIGDILVDQQTACGYVFAQTHIAEYIMEQLDQVKHTHMRCSLVDTIPESLAPSTAHLEVQIASERIDAVVAAVCKCSRSKSLDLFREKKISVGGRVMENPSYEPKPNEVISVRGYGKFIYGGVTYVTKKGKCNVAVEKYI